MTLADNGYEMASLLTYRFARWPATRMAMMWASPVWTQRRPGFRPA